MFKRQAMRGVWAAVAAVFAIALLVMVHVVIYELLALVIPPLWASVAILGFDAIMLLVFGLIATKGAPSRYELEAREVRDQALIEMRESVAISALLHPVGRVAVRAAGRSAWSVLSPKRALRKRRK